MVLSPESYEKIISEFRNPALNSGEVRARIPERLQLERHLALAVSVRAKNIARVIVKELVPNSCPVCHHRLTFLQERIERFENDGRHLIRCPMGHRYPGQVRVYHINIQEEVDKIKKQVQACPECGNESIHYLGPVEIFCLDCDWDSGLEPRYQTQT